MQEIINQALGFLLSASGVSATIAVVLEFAFRMFPSQKPLSIAYIVADAAKGIGSVFVKLGELLDKILPQKIK